MSKKKIKIDDFFKDNLDQYASPVSENMWASIDAQLGQKTNPRKTGLMLFWSVLAVLLIGLLGFVLMQSDESVAVHTNITQPDPVQEMLESKIESNDREVKKVLNQQQVDQNKVATQKELTDKQPLADLKASLEQTKANNTNKFVNKSNDLKVITSSNQTTKNNVLLSNENNIIEQAKNTTNSQRNLDLTPVSEGQQDSSTTNEEQQSTANTFNNVVFDSSLKEKMHRFPVVPLFSTSIKEVQPLQAYDITDKSCPSSFKILHRPTFYFDAVLGIDYANRRFTASSNSEAAQDYIDIREDTEKYASSYSIGARMSVAYNTGFVWRIGLMYHRLNEKINLIGKPEYAHISDVLILEQDNTYQFVDVPILVGYQTNTGKMTYGFNAGMYVNLSFSSPSNYILSADRNKILLNDPVTIDESPVFKGQLGISAYGSLFATYELTDHLSVICEPNVLVRPQSVTLSDYALEQRYVHIGLMTGLRYKF